MKRLFIATSYHHVLAALGKRFADDCPVDLLVSNSWTSDDYWFPLIDRIKCTGWFDGIFFYDERAHRPPSPAKLLSTYRYELREEPQLVESIPGFNLKAYELIYVVNENMFPGATIVRNHLPHVFVEDTTNVYKIATKPPSRLMKYTQRQIKLLYKLTGAFNYWHKIYGYDDSCLWIEVSDKDINWALPHEKLKVVDRNAQIDSIPEDVKKSLLEIFLGNETTLQSLRNQKRRTLIYLSCPYKHGITERELLAACDAALSFHVAEGDFVVVKPHPRDPTDYSKSTFANLVLSRFFPIEVLNFDPSISFDVGVTVGSTSLESARFIRKPVFYTGDQLEQCLSRVNDAGSQ